MKVSTFLRSLARMLPFGAMVSRDERDIVMRHVEGPRVKPDATAQARRVALETRRRINGTERFGCPIEVKVATAGENKILDVRLGLMHAQIEGCDDDLIVRWGRWEKPWMPPKLNEVLVATYHLPNDWRPARMAWNSPVYGGPSVRAVLASDVARHLDEWRQTREREETAHSVTSPGGQA